MEPMEISTPGHAGFATQADALLRKSFTYQKRNKSQNCCLLITPLVIIGFFAFVEHYLKQMSAQRGGAVVEIKKPAPWPPALNIPSNTTRAVSSKYMPFPDLPSPSCRVSGNCPATFLLTGTNQSFVMKKMFPPVSTEDPSDMDRLVLATSVPLFQPNYLVDAAFEPDSPSPLYYLQSKCKANASIPYPTRKVKCLEGLNLWRNSSSDINTEIYKGANKQNKIDNKFAAAFDFQNTNKANFNVTLWNEPSTDADILGSSTFTRLPRLVNLASNAYLQVLQGSDTQLLFEFIKEVPTIFSINASVSKTVDFFLRIASFGLLLFPVTVLLSSIVYEKEKKLRIMMKMHGLRDTAYWAITYIYCLMVSLLFVQFFLIAGKLSGLYFFTKNGYTLQSMFYFLHVNWQISFAFLISTLVSTVKTAQVVGSTFMMLICIFSFFIASRVIESTAFSGSFVVLVEMFPGFALYRGVYEFQKYATFAKNGAGVGMQWQNLNDPGNGIKKAMVIMITEWKIMLSLAYYLDQVLSSGSGRRRSPLFFLHCLRRKPSSQEQYLQRNSSQLFPSNDHSDVAQERQKVEQLMQEGSTSYTAICDNIKKIYPGRDGNPAKAAVRGLSLALGRSECFGMLGPNGAGKTSFISMMIGLTEPTSGTAYVEGLDITTCMNNVYTCMGVCPQFDLLWETLTGREHLYFYGRLKNLRGPVLKRAVEEALKDVNLFHGGVADKHAGKYSGGMKRRLSVAISLIGNPKIVYLDEPSTGLDPASRNSLWNVVKRAKKNRAILLTTHSMEEAEALCDRLGVFVDGALCCIGNPKELKARYGGYFLFTMTTTQSNDTEVENMVLSLCNNAQKTYHLGGTQKFELPKHEVRLADIFQLVEDAKSKFPVQAWALADTTLEDVFIKVTRQAQATSSDE
ncbi:ABC transporter A family member 10 isoform X2 [Spinacia oleracea]|uniref:ABC transporter A family member 10 isoform X2 n=1 Tax=Spinacia oleracea TaxID=3562 RepID=A0ABM3QSX3_SPIOL|nr:ABC transporter A family member 10-like isoform X2 [Spinacia oleracea]